MDKRSEQQQNISTASTSPFHVMVIGGGLGGLCLAQGLKKAGISVAVYERDRTRGERLQGYRIHIDPQGSRALHECLPSHLYDTFVVTSGMEGQGIGFLGEQLQEYIFLGRDELDTNPDPVNSSKSVSRITLRQVLLAELDEMVHFDKAFTHYEEMSDGKITAFFEDGTTATGDVLVAADGGNSRVRKQFLPHALRVETGSMGIMGKVPLTDETRKQISRDWFKGAAFVLGPGGRSMFIAAQEYRKRPNAMSAIGGNDENIDLNPGLLFDNISDYVFWAIVARNEKFPFQSDPQQMEGAALQQIAQTMIEGWHPRLRQLVHTSDPTSVIATPLRTSEPVEHWQTRRITLIGDAIHSMTPLQGVGGNTALRDASLLCKNLIAAQRGEMPLLRAIHDYEVEMIRYGFSAVRRSKQTLDLAVSENPVVRTALKVVLRSINVVLSLRRLRSVE